MKIVVIGASGLIGSNVVKRLRLQGHEVVAASLSTGVNLLTGAGLAAAIQGADTVVDVSNSPSFEDQAVMDFFQTAGRNLLAAEAAAGVRHHVALSVVGADRLPDNGYMRAKVAQEALIKDSGIPYTILRSTQFFEFVDGIIKSSGGDDTVHLSPALLQPVASDDTSARLAEVAAMPPANGMLEVAGPDLIPLDELARLYLAARQDATRRIVADARARYFGSVLDDRSLTAGKGAYIGATRYQDWLASVAGRA
ncbi:NmrA family transcriptional regulator [Bordetella genomosp. 8]|uniref:NmrA family transcriptional regulator n=1 Tax=Bordetella genomosp. 8 TaxID=1416806 RepID=A0A1W6YKP3_9BORD|nr:SDR family oxidoreductase [Bordetella genomosp. 8]ARP81637.1 NmrA family transcriptional regulator [Bordetella genomosp. 8]